MNDYMYNFTSTTCPTSVAESMVQYNVKILMYMMKVATICPTRVAESLLECKVTCIYIHLMEFFLLCATIAEGSVEGLGS